MPHRFTLTIALGNEAMDDGTDVADALYAAARKIEAYGFENDVIGTIRDRNGNTVGRWEVA